MAINYKTVLGLAAQLMVLLIGIGKTFLDDYYNQMSKGISLKEMGVMLIVAVILLVLATKVPQMLAGIITGASVGSGWGDSSTGSTPFAQAAGFSGSRMSGGNDVGDAKGRAESDASSSDQAKGHGQKADNSATARGTRGGQQSSGAQGGGGFMAAAAKAGKIAADAGANLAKRTAEVAISKAASMKESAMDRIADTAGGKMAAAIKASGAGAGSDAGAGAAPGTGSEFTGNNLGGDAGGWINQTGGFSELSEADQARASESHAEWRAKNEGNTFGVEDYVLYMQERQQEQASFLDKPQKEV